MIREIATPSGFRLFYQGPDLADGPLPTFFYFSISGRESLELAPYNTPATLLREERGLRVFSANLPGHEEDQDKFEGIKFWAEKMAAGERPLEDFIDKMVGSIDWLIASGISTEKIVCGGLSRGGFIATHVAAKEKRVKGVVGFAPATDLSKLQDFAGFQTDKLRLIDSCEELLHLQGLYYIVGNRDLAVDTDSCYKFIRTLTETAYEKRVRELKIYLQIVPSIGHRGHGTSPDSFEEGTNFVRKLLL